MQAIKNRKAFFDYEVLDTLEVGISLQGHEVKSVKEGQISLKDSYVVVQDGELYLINANISKYQHAAEISYDPQRSRKLLAKKKEIVSLSSKVQQKKLTVVPLKVYVKGKNIKVEIGLVKGKKKYEKKEAIKQRDLDRELHREKRKFVG